MQTYLSHCWPTTHTHTHTHTHTQTHTHIYIYIHTYTKCISQEPRRNLNQSIIYNKSLFSYFPSLFFPLIISSNQIPIVFPAGQIKYSSPFRGKNSFTALSKPRSTSKSMSSQIVFLLTKIHIQVEAMQLHIRGRK